MPDAIADEIENDILPDLSDEFEEESAGADRLPAYLLDQCRVYFRERNLDLFTSRITAIAQGGELAEAEAEASSYKPLQESANSDLELSSPELEARMEQAFAETSEILIAYPGALGKFWNNQLVRGGFVGLLAPEKRGKTFLLMDMSIRGCRQGNKNRFFHLNRLMQKYGAENSIFRRQNLLPEQIQNQPLRPFSTASAQRKASCVRLHKR